MSFSVVEICKAFMFCACMQICPDRTKIVNKVFLIQYSIIRVKKFSLTQSYDRWPPSPCQNVEKTVVYVANTKKQTDKQVFLLFCRISYVLIVLPTVSKEKGAAPLLEQAVYRIFISKTLSAGINVPGRYCKNGPAVVRSMICRPD